MSRRRVAGWALATAACLSPGCKSADRHLADTSHPWHAFPYYAGFAGGTLPLLPLALVEGIARGDGTCLTGVTPYVASKAGHGLAFVVGGAFWAVLWPLELLFPPSPEPPRGEPLDPDQS